LGFLLLVKTIRKTIEEDEMGATYGMSVCRLRSESTLTAKGGYLRIIKRSKIGKG
jgi:hypothetical protein